MVKKSNSQDIREVLSAVLTLNYMKKYTGIEELAAEVNGLVDYTIDLFEGISKNNNYCFGRTFSYNITMTQDRIIIISEKDDRSNFLTFISLLQFVFIDEQIFLSGKIDVGKNVLSDNALFGTFMPPFADITSKEFLINVSEPFLNNEYNNTITNGNRHFLAFIDIVYNYSPFKDAEGNMLRHIVEPIKKSMKTANKAQTKKFEFLSEYCDKYANDNGFSSKHKIKIQAKR